MSLGRKLGVLLLWGASFLPSANAWALELDATFGNGGVKEIALSDGTVAFGVYQRSNGGFWTTEFWRSHSNERCEIRLKRYDAGGNLDPNFGLAPSIVAASCFIEGDDKPVNHQLMRQPAEHPDGRVTVAIHTKKGSCTDGVCETGSMKVCQLQANGSLDLGFGSQGCIDIPFTIWDLAVRPKTGDILLYGDPQPPTARIERAFYSLLPNGQLDRTFAGGIGTLETMLTAPRFGIDALERIIVAGPSPKNELVVHRWQPDGTPDESFGIGGRSQFSDLRGMKGGDTVTDLEIDTYGRILFSYVDILDYNDFPRHYRRGLVRLQASGHLDETFGDHGVVAQEFFDDELIHGQDSIWPRSDGVLWKLAQYSQANATWLALDETGKSDITTFPPNGVYEDDHRVWKSTSLRLGTSGQDGKMLVKTIEGRTRIIKRYLLP